MRDILEPYVRIAILMALFGMVHIFTTIDIRATTAITLR